MSALLAVILLLCVRLYCVWICITLKFSAEIFRKPLSRYKPQPFYFFIKMSFPGKGLISVSFTFSNCTFRR
ncbi:MAG: hypothetical protein AVDCRST_MAG96-3474 [uncultured Segetibacter sp.]|uniref:Uncharacterized protein n=1 Tax=uncultured Segetibacter sp. TaxID=481133 RepID=A0A6J4TQL4_9BACT|nr:MAG: hypothetical protein AVDCRST_MAG96-3474 [uncultured Segetibacter sp.]